MREGRIVRGVGGLYTVRAEDGGAYVLRAKGRFRRERLPPLVGDKARFTPGQGAEHGWLEEILPRASVCRRPPPPTSAWKFWWSRRSRGRTGCC